MKRFGFFLAVLFLGSGWAEDKESTLTFQRTEVTSPLKIGSRPRATPHTMIYARIQPYDLYGNYLEEWIDRPLYHNREFRDSASGHLAAFKRDVDAAKEYEIEGFTMLGNAYASRYKTVLDWLKQNKIRNFSFMSGIAWSRGIDYSRYLNTVRLAVGSPYTAGFRSSVMFPSRRKTSGKSGNVLPRTVFPMYCCSTISGWMSLRNTTVQENFPMPHCRKPVRQSGKN